MLLDALDWIGHSGFRLRAGRETVYIDPYRVAPDAPKADLILVTHGHYDHFSPQDIERLSHERTWLVAPAAVAERVTGRVISIAPGLGQLSGVIQALAVAHPSPSTPEYPDKGPTTAPSRP